MLRKLPYHHNALYVLVVGGLPIAGKLYLSFCNTQQKISSILGHCINLDFHWIVASLNVAVMSSSSWCPWYPLWVTIALCVFQSTPDYEEAIPIPNSNVSHHVPYSVIRVIGEWEDLILAVFIMDKNLTGKLCWTLEFLSLFSYPSPLLSTPPPISHLLPPPPLPSPSSSHYSPFPSFSHFPVLLPLPHMSSIHRMVGAASGGTQITW